MMKRLLLLPLAALGLMIATGQAHAWGWGYKPCCNVHSGCPCPEDQRLQRFWHDYYSSMRTYYGKAKKIDWVAYYKNHGTQMQPGCDGSGGGNPYQRVHYHPVVVVPQMQWLNPQSPVGGCGLPPGGGADFAPMPGPGY